jgi:hypothetical protein
VHGVHAATSKVKNSAQGSSCQLKFVHGNCDIEFEQKISFSYESVTVQDQNVIQIWSLKKCLFSTVEYRLRFEQNLVLIPVILHERHWTQWSYAAFCAQLGLLSALIQSTTHFEWIFNKIYRHLIRIR